MKSQPSAAPSAHPDLDQALQRQGRLRTLMFLDSVVAELELASRLGISPMLDYYRARRVALAFELGINDGDQAPQK